MLGRFWAAIAFWSCLCQPVSAAGIDEAGYRRIGGLDQWVTIHGKDTSNPILLIVHGGPGDPESPFVKQFEPYETGFTVVQWDQRGSGKTYARYGSKTPDMTIDRIAGDGIELTGILRKRFHRKVIVLGHSAGSVVAVDMVLERPELFAAYVGTGQVVSSAKTVAATAKFVRTIAELSGDHALEHDLDVLAGIDPTNVPQLFAHLGEILAVSRVQRRHLGPADSAWLAGLPDLTKQVSTSAELKDIFDGSQFTSRTLDTAHVDLEQTALRFKLPVFVIQGRDDLFAPTGLAIEWFDQVAAPRKEMILLEDAGHFALVTHQTEFLAALLKTARPLAAD
jgi:pimeloyl-ACP methyl ester carboxylesterase